jgi:hypothetical protein
MRLFQFHHRGGIDHAPVPGLAETAAARGWRSAPDPPFDKDLRDTLYELACDLYGVPRGSVGQEMGRNWRGIGFHDAFRFSDAGRAVTVANARAGLAYEVRWVANPDMWIAVCAVELPALLAPGRVQSRRYPPLLHLVDAPTGNPPFDERYATSRPAPGAAWLTPEVQRLLLTHDDWVLLALGTALVCLTQGSFTTADDVVRRARDVLDLVAAIPATVVPDHVDRSVDDLAARISRIESIGDAITFLQGLTDDDRERLARSDTPLAAFADVRTPEDATARFQALPPAQQMQLMALFMRAGG